MERVKGEGRSYVKLMAIIAILAATIDQVTKAIMLATLEPGIPQPVIGDWFRFYLLFNPGAAFSMGTNSTWLFTTIQLCFVLGIAWYSSKVPEKWQAIGLALIAGGALGNLIDRLFRDPGFYFGHVVDFISVGSFAVFNIADSCITIGVICFVFGVMREDRAHA